MPPASRSATNNSKRSTLVTSPYFKNEKSNSVKVKSKVHIKTTTFQVKANSDSNTVLPPVPDILDYDLRVLFVGINGGVTSSKRGHHFASPTNHFWPCLSASGLVDRKVTFEDDVLLPKSYGLGFTNLTPKVSRRATDLTVAEQLDNVPQLTEKIKEYRPKWVVFIGMGMYQIYSGRKKVGVGLQAETIPWKVETGRSNIFVMPSTSGLVAAYHKKDKIKYFIELAKLVRLDHSV
ncbi:hypothetical protein K450DRAFT_249520 [Umbelopsis ramanniana AG]|uniref:G/T mismatch-specific thymine DNA glycosylase n=1 Tax=Umbelopsis ramanniana AG TaxID=1314678 RepID=A0AAD5E740_UMBRA|nr:uncharacterized protein K450DRAFT_249520 [Umbelopsis ramanniana AG]KAI8578019.1 hypothetical protein K450DRAFT_249520 [Umbelopsis ramanniana AG]